MRIFECWWYFLEHKVQIEYGRTESKWNEITETNTGELLLYTIGEQFYVKFLNILMLLFRSRRSRQHSKEEIIVWSSIMKIVCCSVATVILSVCYSTGSEIHFVYINSGFIMSSSKQYLFLYSILFYVSFIVLGN